MSYTTKERNNAIRLIADSNADLKNISMYESLESFNWITVKRLNGIIQSVELTYSGKDLSKRLLKM